ncbi:MAG TPA: agmatinase [Saprospiraceae bacterium]|nr:agmatinase [Saprospiraceae bacterium]HMQ84057.1 agmatinase [Saprospiraceae bacterium]
MINLLGIPYDANSSFLRGAALGPARIRLMEKEGSANIYAESGMPIEPGITYQDGGDLPFEDSHPEKAFQAIYNAIDRLLTQGKRVLSLGGDHSVSFPIIDAYTDHYPDLHVLHLDAHGDLYHNFDNNPYSHASPFARIMEKGKVKSLTQVGVRTLSSHQREQAERFGVQVIEMKDFTTDFIPRLKSPLYVSLDMDVLDPAYAPGVSHHEPGGMNTRTLLDILQKIPATIVGADIVEFNPTRDWQDITAMTGYKLMKELMAKML